MKPTLAVLALTATLSCGGGTDSPPPDCTGTTCACPPGEPCDLSGSACAGDSCSLDCSDHNECTGSCGASCSIDCGGGSTCDVTVGDSGSVTCSEGSICHVRCTAACSVSCSPDSTCDLTCADQTEPEPIPEGGSCA